MNLKEKENGICLLNLVKILVTMFHNYKTSKHKRTPKTMKC